MCCYWYNVFPTSSRDCSTSNFFGLQQVCCVASRKCCKQLFIDFIKTDFFHILKVSSNYGLLSTEAVYSPVDTGSKVTVPFYPGCLYAAYKGEKDQTVRNSYIDHTIYLITYKGSDSQLLLVKAILTSVPLL